MRIWGIFAISFLLSGLGACGIVRVSDECDCGFYTIEGTQKMLHWKDGATVKFRLDATMPDSFKLAMSQVGKEYNSILANTQIKIEETRNENGEVTASLAAPAYNKKDPRSVSGDGINGIYWVTEDWPWAESDPESDAMTVLSFSTAGIMEADIYFRAENFGEPSMTSPQAQSLFSTESGFDVKSADQESKWVFVLGLHEMGHAMGRVHSHDKKSMMYKSVGLSFVANSFAQGDLEILSKAYQLKDQPTDTSNAALASSR